MTISKSRKDYKRWISSQEGQRIKSKIIKHQCYLCYHCKGPLNIGSAEIDHLVPLALGGSNNISNLYASCRPCNRSKGNRIIGQPIYWWLQEPESYNEQQP